ncbi:hypothetical protein HOY82DRAFT_666248 [Tuber indicum]|nr:hypothetical protein HOY82DRAFT_666248 [Tuber indicum]
MSLSSGGAGISTSTIILGFYKPGACLYCNLQTLNLLHPEAAFDTSSGQTNLQPFYIPAKLLHSSLFTITATHAFIQPAAKKNLHKFFAWNIDMFGHPEEVIHEAGREFYPARETEITAVDSGVGGFQEFVTLYLRLETGCLSSLWRQSPLSDRQRGGAG